MEAKFSPKVKEVISYSREEALRLGHDFIGTEHLLLGLIRDGEGLAIKVLKSMDIDIILLRKAIEDSIRDKAIHNHNVNVNNLPLTKQAEKVLKITILEAKVQKSDTIGTEHLILSILKNKDTVVTEVLSRFDIDYDSFKAELDFLQQELKDESPHERQDEDEGFEEEKSRQGSSTRKAPAAKSRTPVLDNFGRDITRQAEEGSLDPIVGRDIEIERVSQILSRRKKK